MTQSDNLDGSGETKTRMRDEGRIKDEKGEGLKRRELFISLLQLRIKGTSFNRRISLNVLFAICHSSGELENRSMLGHD